MSNTKFRFWNGHGFQFVSYMQWYEDGSIAEYGNDATSIVFDPFHENTLEQYTGIHDANGKEIYEGDIVHMEQVSLGDPESLTGLVELVEGQWLVTSEKHQRAVPLYEETMVGRVFGDVHQNPELLGDE